MANGTNPTNLNPVSPQQPVRPPGGQTAKGTGTDAAKRIIKHQTWNKDKTGEIAPRLMKQASQQAAEIARETRIDSYKSVLYERLKEKAGVTKDDTPEQISEKINLYNTKISKKSNKATGAASNKQIRSARPRGDTLKEAEQLHQEATELLGRIKDKNDISELPRLKQVQQKLTAKAKVVDAQRKLIPSNTADPVFREKRKKLDVMHDKLLKLTSSIPTESYRLERHKEKVETAQQLLSQYKTLLKEQGPAIRKISQFGTLLSNLKDAQLRYDSAKSIDSSHKSAHSEKMLSETWRERELALKALRDKNRISKEEIPKLEELVQSLKKLHAEMDSFSSIHASTWHAFNETLDPVTQQSLGLNFSHARGEVYLLQGVEFDILKDKTS